MSFPGELRRVLFRSFRLLFMVALVFLPLPIVMAIAVVVDPARRNLPAEVLRRKRR
ncbi:MAG: hypothetical protein WBV82_14080 [Myxococcaceae bacterium]